MKELKYLVVVLAVVGILITGCKKAEEVNFDVTYITDLDVVVPPESRIVSFSAENTIDPLSDENVERYATDITSYQLDSLIAGVTEISKNVTLVWGDLSINHSTKHAIWHFENITLSDGATIPLGNDNGQWETVKEIFGTGKIVVVKIKGQTDTGDVNFTIQVVIQASVTAN